MCSHANQVLINNVLDDFIGQGRAFTAFEVSIEAKKRGADERHRDMRAYIHQCACLNDELEFGAYEKTLVDVGGGNQAFLYHPNTYDPSQYVPLDTNNAPSTPTPVAAPVASAAAPVATPVATSTDDDDDDGSDIGHNLDHRNRLMIPTKFFRDIGVTSGDRVQVVRQSQGGLRIVPTSVSVDDADKATEQVVERNGDLRLSLGTLLSAGLSGGNFQVENSTYNGDSAIEVYNIDSDGNRI